MMARKHAKLRAVSMLVAGLTAASCGSPGVREGIADLDFFPDARSMVRHGTLVVIATPVGEPTPSKVLADGRNADYRQDFDVQQTLWGEPSESVTVVRFGPSSQDAADDAEGGAGALPQHRLILVLQPGGEAGTYSVVGHTQGALDFRTGEVQGSEFSELNGLNQEEFAAFVRSSQSRP